MLVQLRPDVSCSGGATTLNINGLGAKPIYSLDGSSNLGANDCRAGRPTWLMYSTALNGGNGAFVNQSVANLPASAPSGTTVAFSATPTFMVTGAFQEFTMTLTGNVTSSTLAGAITNGVLIFQICQDSTGGRTFAWPTGFAAAATISPTAGSCTKQQFVWDGVNANPSAPAASTDTPFLISGAPERTAPAVPASSVASLWPDSTRHTWTSEENNSTNVHIMPRTAGGTDQLASTDLSDAVNINLLNANQTVTGDKTSSGKVDNSGATHTLPSKTGLAANRPATCSTGEEYFATDATAGQNKYYCTSTNTWTQQTAGGSVYVPPLAAYPGGNVTLSGAALYAFATGPAFVFAYFPACSSSIEGYAHAVTDSTTTTFNGVVTGGGSNHVQAYCNGTNWVVQ
jgi:hypothetical protein